jgi:hypothetical protein
MDEYRDRSRLLRRQFGAQTGGYDTTEDWENQERIRNIRSQPIAIQAWLRGENLLLSAFYSPTPSLRYSSGETEVNDAHRSFWLYYSLITLASRATKPTLDLILASYYSEALALERTMLEGWVRAVFVRLMKQNQPSVWRRWHEPYREELTGPPPTREPGWGEAADYIRRWGDSEDKRLIEEAQQRWNFLNLGAHPSRYGIDQMHDAALNLMKFHPEFDEDYCVHALNHGIFIQTLLLRETKSLTDFPVGWLEQLDEFLALAQPLADAVKPLLEVYARALKIERNAARAETKKSKTKRSDQEGPAAE